MAVETFTSSTTWTCPSGVTSVGVECWGYGGFGGSTAASVSRSGGGGGGGELVRMRILRNSADSKWDILESRVQP